MQRDHGREYLRLRSFLGAVDSHRAATTLLALVHGLRLAVSREDALPLADARDIVDDHVSRAQPPPPPGAG